MGGYNNYDAGPTQDSFYQNGNGNFNATVPGQYGASPDSPSRFSQGYGTFEDGPGSNFGQGGYGGRPFKRVQRRERDDKYETNSEDVRRLFEEHGEIRTFFDLIANRGMVFVTYYDLRAAERARDRLQGSEISGRPIDVHYSLPRDDHGGRGGDKDKNQQLQGTLLVTLRNSVTGQAIDDNEVRRKFQQFGDVKAVKPVGDRTDQRFVEFYDTRACEEAHDRLRHQGLQDGVMDIVFASDAEDPRGASPRREDRGFDRGRDWDEPPPPRGRRGGRGGRGRGRGGFSGEDWDRRGEWGRDRDRGRPYDDDYAGGRGGGRNGNYDDRFDGRSGGGYGGPPGPSGYGGGSPAPVYNQPSAPAPPVDERLEQAKKVQQLLAALKQPGQGGASAPATPTAPSAPPATMPPMPQPASTANNYYTSPPMPMPPPPPQHPPFPPNGVPPAASQNPYSSMPPQSSTPQPPQPPAATLATLPPNLLALLQQNGQIPPQQPTPSSMPPVQYNMPPQQMMASPPPVPGVSAMPSNSQAGYQQLMAYLSQKRA
ncbi:hypothetical protein AcV7_001196 [Taiwanofungus camphoratus]|nr:hypothetical protein AcV7_001196 [Antrodia cinnamomea]